MVAVFQFKQHCQMSEHHTEYLHVLAERILPKPNYRIFKDTPFSNTGLLSLNTIKNIFCYANVANNIQIFQKF
jgi:hypothetical protein